MHTMAKVIEETEIVATKGNHSLEFVDGVTKKSVFSTGGGTDNILAEEDVLIKGNTVLNLGKGVDRIELTGDIKSYH